MDKIAELGQGMNKAIGMTLGEEILEAMWECIKIRILEDRIIEVDIEEIIGMKIMKEVGVGLEKASYSGNIRRNDRNSSSSRSRSGSRVSTNRDRIRCYKCREYDHFVKRCLNNQRRKRDRSNTADVQFRWRTNIIKNVSYRYIW